MSNLMASLSTASNALDVFQQALSVVQNNVDNASTPGFARQSLNLNAMPVDVAGGLAGGVATQGLDNSRDEYAEEAVQQQNQSLGQYTAQAQATGSMQSLFDITGTSGVATALNTLFQGFSAWSTTPSDPAARQTVISDAAGLAQSVQGLANSLSQTGTQLNGQISATVSQINAIASQIQQYNSQRRQENQPDPGQDAQLHSALENLSQLTNFSTVTQSDGTVMVLLGGGSPLVIGTQQYSLSASASSGQSQILDSQGNDITAQVASGQLGGLLDSRNRVLGSILGDSTQQGTLNQLAQTLAGSVNQILESGTVSSDPGAANGTALFTYDSSNPTGIAASLVVNQSITPDQLAPVDSNGNANGNANALAALGTASSGPGTLGGMSLVQYFGQMAANIGQENATATANQSTQQQVVAQAKSLRDQISGVSLDQEAVNVLQFQRAYQATAQVITVLNTLADSVLSLIPPG